jgi:hypothetical protein
MKKRIVLGTLATLAMLSSLTVPVSAQVIGTQSTTEDVAVSSGETFSDEVLTNIIKSAVSKYNIADSEIKSIVSQIKESGVDLTDRTSILNYVQSYVSNSLTLGDSGEQSVTTAVTTTSSKGATTSSTEATTTTTAATTTAQATLKTVTFPNTDVILKSKDGKFSGKWNTTGGELFGTLEGSYASKNIKGTLTVGTDTFTIKGTYTDDYKISGEVNGFVFHGYIDPDNGAAVLTPDEEQSHEVSPDGVSVVTTTTKSNSSSNGSSSSTKTTTSGEDTSPGTGDNSSLPAMLLTGSLAFGSAGLLKKKN